MPCRTDWPEENYTLTNTRKGLDEITSILCSVMRTLSKSNDDGLPSWVPERAVEWYQKHLESDKARMEKLQEELEQHMFTANALGKLELKELKSLELTGVLMNAKTQITRIKKELNSFYGPL